MAADDPDAPEGAEPGTAPVSAAVSTAAPTVVSAAVSTAADPDPRLDRSRRWGRVLELVHAAAPRVVAVTELARALDVSTATLRRDLAVLADQQLLRRSHGGACAVTDGPELPVRYRDAEQRAAKHAIAREAASRVPRGAHALGLTGGSTTGAVARCLVDRARLTVITNALNVALDLAPHPQVKVVMTGGVARSQSFELVGPWAEQTLQAVNLGTAVVGVDGISASAGLTTHDETEAAVNAAMISRARRTIVVADGTKLGRAHLARICALGDVDELVTDTGAATAEVEELRRAGLRVTVVPS